MGKRILVTWGSKRGGTEGIARIVAQAFEEEGYEVVAKPAREVGRVQGFDAVIVGGALYAFHWHRDAVGFVRRNVGRLRRVPVWLFSSGPLDDSAAKKVIPPIEQVLVLAERVGAVDHVTFGGRLEKDAKGMPASAMAKEHAGDWRDEGRIRSWALDVARALPDAKPRAPVEHPARSLPRLFAFGFAGWALCAATMGGLMTVASETVAIVAHAIVAPVVFFGLSRLYFQSHGAREPLPVAAVWTGLVLAFDVALAAVVLHDFAMFGSFAGTWLPFALVFLATWGTGEMMLMGPFETPEEAE